MLASRQLITGSPAGLRIAHRRQNSHQLSDEFTMLTFGTGLPLATPAGRKERGKFVLQLNWMGARLEEFEFLDRAKNEDQGGKNA